ncbi:hypothetical protein Rvan_1465 [Rhodomicrobium vannielii ATCC 17100]|uniref:Uncharacterized protein n=1 Tax=Rhodomicrobium vannielii (strain ATCC 17100 / DSM 162 / LMG 4299 / NCIMB 10020 / ATH 3.1.1) TaxID=648757 RepID=E3I769_RHOVT|nr:hypothetical protein [Rhodomicrobium vannielii]ADP70720.1 hypothetical protein Rvan_1465 [Rhodomicrobium vannielii ATCC 17100]
MESALDIPGYEGLVSKIAESVTPRDIALTMIGRAAFAAESGTAFLDAFTAELSALIAANDEKLRSVLARPTWKPVSEAQPATPYLLAWFEERPLPRWVCEYAVYSGRRPDGGEWRHGRATHVMEVTSPQVEAAQ